jgi:capsular exopolysaccharide synthesis family protein
MEKTNNEWHENAPKTTLIDIIYEYIRYWKWFVLATAFSLAVGLVIIMTTEKEYKSTIAILLNEDKNKGGARNTSELSLDELGLLSTTNNIDNEIAILASPDLMRGVVDSLNLVTSYYVKDMLRNKELYNESPFSVEFSKKTEDFPGDINFIITKNGNQFAIEGKYIVHNDYEVTIKEQTDQLPFLIILPEDLGVISIAATDKEIEEDIDYNIYISNPTLIARKLGTALSIGQTTKTSSALNMTLLVNNTTKGAAILRELVRQYNIQNTRVNNQISYNTALFINERLKEITIELSDVERDVVDYKQQHRITDLISEAQLSIQETGHNKERLMEIETQLNVINMVEKFVNNPSNELNIIPNLGISDLTLSQIINEYNNKLLSTEALLKNTGAENPMRIRVMEEIRNMRNSISSSLLNVKQAYNISKQDLQRLSGSTASRIESIPQQEKGLLERVRQQQVKESLFLFLMQKREETNISIASVSDKARIIASPQIKLLPIAPKTSIILLAALIIGLLTPIIIIYILNIFKTKIESRTELEKLTRVSIIGQINKTKNKNQLIVQSDPNGNTAELFRLLRNNLNFILKNQDHKIILITSTLTGEGKTFISTNLAITYILSKKKVLLIGGDMRKPKIKNYLKINKQEGLSDYLISDNNDWHDYLIKSDLSPNLDIMISGIIPPNPNELLMTSKLKTLLAETKKEYDIVIIDTAPVGMVSDTYLFDEHIDATLYIIRENVTPKNAINFINTQKKENRLHNMYIVLNDTSLNKYSGYKYGYAKGYGYREK